MLNAAWDVCVPVSSENALLCHDRVGYNKILDNSKPLTDPDGRHLSSFTYLRLGPLLMERHNFMEFDRFVKRMHGTILIFVISPIESVQKIRITSIYENTSIDKHNKQKKQIQFLTLSVVTFHFHCRGSCS